MNYLSKILIEYEKAKIQNIKTIIQKLIDSFLKKHLIANDYKK